MSTTTFVILDTLLSLGVPGAFVIWDYYHTKRIIARRQAAKAAAASASAPEPAEEAPLPAFKQAA